VTDELARGARVQASRWGRLRAIIDSARPQVSELVGKVVTARLDQAASSEDLRACASR